MYLINLLYILHIFTSLRTHSSNRQELTGWCHCDVCESHTHRPPIAIHYTRLSPDIVWFWVITYLHTCTTGGGLQTQPNFRRGFRQRPNEPTPTELPSSPLIVPGPPENQFLNFSVFQMFSFSSVRIIRCNVFPGCSVVFVSYFVRFFPFSRPQKTARGKKTARDRKPPGTENWDKNASSSIANSAPPQCVMICIYSFSSALRFPPPEEVFPGVKIPKRTPNFG